VKGEALDKKAKRAKARWLGRVMCSDATSTEKCFAYLIADKLNCVTLDCWPGQETLAALLSRRSVKSVIRAAGGLQKRGFITIKSRAEGEPGYRYAPIFVPDDQYENVRASGQSCPSSEDMDVGESSLDILLKESLAPSSPISGGRRSGQPNKAYKRGQRGALEATVAELFGTDGWNVLERLSSLDDRIVDRLCRASFEGSLSQRDLNAARLAAKQMNGSRSGHHTRPSGKAWGEGGLNLWSFFGVRTGSSLCTQNCEIQKESPRGGGGV
jgi:hypothetical protein